MVRDDLLVGGTKSRLAHLILNDKSEYVYASPVYGYAQVALAHAARLHGKHATIFCAKRAVLHPRTLEAIAAGATIKQCPTGYMSVVRARAKEYCALSGAELVPFGFESPAIISELSRVARSLNLNPAEVWTVAGSGVLTRALQDAWPSASFHAVQVGAVPSAGRARIHVAPEKFEQNAVAPPPFPSCLNYDAKAWRFMKAFAKPGALFWNVAS